MESVNFYSSIPVLDNFSQVSDLSNYVRLPDDWLIVAADVQNSTNAIKNGQYKAVNIAGVCVITSIRNVAGPIELPYIFGGDGATLCVPPSVLGETRNALIATRQMVHDQFGLNLRVGIIPVETVKKAGYEVLVARHRMSEFYIQAAFSGGGVEYAEGLIKDEYRGSMYQLPETPEPLSTDYSGLECRWDHIPSRHGEIIAVIVKAVAATTEEQVAIYREIIETIRQVYGDDDTCRPVYESGLRFTCNNKKLGHELRVRTYGSGWWQVLSHWLLIRIQNVLGRVFMHYNLNVADIPWGRYRKDLVSNTDFKKFDGVLRQVISGTVEQRQELENFLHKKFKAGQCNYGIHVSDSALITCMINNRSGEHFHFVDGAGGGYAMAATGFKKQQEEMNDKN